jgi:hypothetical protein
MRVLSKDGVDGPGSQAPLFIIVGGPELDHLLSFFE